MSELTENEIINALKNGGTWNGPTTYGQPLNITYSFPATASGYYANALAFMGITTLEGYFQHQGASLSSVDDLSNDQQFAALQAMATWASVANITFSPSTNGDIALLNVSLADSNTRAFTTGSIGGLGNPTDNGDIWINIHQGSQVASDNLNQLQPSQFGFFTLLHELGHALGLKHPGDYSQFGSQGDFAPFLPANDDTRHTVMSYNRINGWLPSKPMLYDILAIQTLYGVNPNTNSDDNLVGELAYKFKTGADAVQAIWDAGGTDVINANDQTQSVTIDLNPGHFSFVGKAEQTSQQLIAIAYRVEDPNFDWQNNWIENAVGGSGNDRLIGNDAANTLTGGKGSDTLEGGLGDDTYQLESTDNGFDRIIDSDRNGTIIVDGDIISDVFRPFVDGTAFYTEDKLYEFKKEKDSSNWQLSAQHLSL
ncbi:MAG: M10 family metallopeptidase [Methylococcales bacterium]|nr:M10 family metallopeptidase [Methylococcales bacterium]